MILEAIQDAEMVLVGLGEEFDDLAQVRQMLGYEEGKANLLQSAESSMMPAWQSLFRSEQTSKIVRSLENLAKILENKNYFVISVSTNKDIATIPWRQGRLVMPCGSDMYKQCSNGCEGNLTLLAEGERQLLTDQLKDFRDNILQGRKECQVDGLGICPICNEKIRLNNIYSEQYDEDGYLPVWQTYTKWLQGTVNRKLVVLELGVGMKFPSVIRFPFEKIAYFNQKAKFYRINKNLYHLTEELAAKGVGIADNAIDWLENLC